MADSTVMIIKQQNAEENEYSSFTGEVKSLVAALPTKNVLPVDICEYQGYWIEKPFLTGILIAHKYFQTQPSTVILASQPKCGTTWLKALAFTIMNRSRFDFATHPLLSSNPHDCVKYLDLYAYFNPTSPNPTDSLLATHSPYPLLPETIRSSSCPIIYIAREPKDIFVSRWNFLSKLRPDDASSTSLEQQFDMFCKGISPSGPCWDSILGYWKASLESPKKVLFLRYEDLKKEPHTQVKKMAEFIGLPFSEDEEKDGVIQKVIDLCSFDNLKRLEINQGEAPFDPNSARLGAKNHVFFRQGKVGDYKNFLTEDMIKRIDEITESNFKGSRLVFNQ